MARVSGALILSAALAVSAFAGVRAATDQSAPRDTSSDSNEVQEVTVTAQRATLTARVTAFVSKITKAPFEGGMALWRIPVCPLVSGVPREDGEFILDRVSDVARVDGIPLGGENCHPNLFILVSKQPQEMLREMSKRNVWFTFGFGAHPSEIGEFISKAGPVRVLYRDFPSILCQNPPCEIPTVSAAKVGPITMAGDGWYFDGHSAKYQVVWQVFRVFVIVDASQVKGVTLGQFADYVSLVGLAELKPADTLADAPTILKLFSGAPQAAPAGMTDWDQAFLKSVYTTDQSSHGQRVHVVRAMVSQMVH